jgi:hypothetical protein
MDKTKSGANDAQLNSLPMIAMFLAGAVAFGMWQNHSAQQKLSTFIRSCPNLSTSNPVAMRTPEGRILIISMMDVPEQYMSAFCPDLNEMSEAASLPVENSAPK